MPPKEKAVVIEMLGKDQPVVFHGPLSWKVEERRWLSLPVAKHAPADARLPDCPVFSPGPVDQE
ncbi:MAG: hypothetical protein Kow0089_20080 [Desulfobulbaceae bacterium]